MASKSSTSFPSYGSSQINLLHTQFTLSFRILVTYSDSAGVLHIVTKLLYNALVTSCFLDYRWFAVELRLYRSEICTYLFQVLFITRNWLSVRKGETLSIEARKLLRLPAFYKIESCKWIFPKLYYRFSLCGQLNLPAFEQPFNFNNRSHLLPASKRMT